MMNCVSSFVILIVFLHGSCGDRTLSQFAASKSQTSCVIGVLDELKAWITKLEEAKEITDAVKGGVVYTRWGRKDCPLGSNLIYTGAAGGNHYSGKGGPANTLCLPMDPEYNNYTTNYHDWGYMYGTEYETFDQLPEFKNFQDEDVPCAVCETPQKSRTLMIPAKMSCPPGWRQEYTGYLMGGHYKYAASDFVCVDKEPQSLRGGLNNDNGHVIYFIEGVCGSLKCPPYKQYWELTCVVCSK